MRVFLFYFLILTSVFSFGQKNRNTIGFTENKGQIINQKGKANTAVLYLLNTPGLNVQLKKNSFSYDIYETTKIPLTEKDKAFLAPQNKFGEREETLNHSIEYHYHRIDIDFLNANPNVLLVAEKKSTDYDNYYNVSHAPEGITNVYKYQKVTYKNLYNNIDAVFFIPNDSTKVMEYNFIVRPGGKISDIQLKFNGAKTELNDNKIKMKVRFGEMEETLPLSWIEQGSSRKEIAVGYTKIKKNVYGFEGDLNTSDKTIVIDPVPVRLWGTYYGSGGNTYEGTHISVDSFNNVYYNGSTGSPNNIATSGTHQSYISGILDGFIIKFDTNGNRIWGTYYGGSDRDSVYTTDIMNNYIIITGSTWSSDNIATNGTYSTQYNPGNGVTTSSRGDCFVAKLNLDGIRIWGTYFGGEANDYPLSITIDIGGNIVLTGSTFSVNNISTPGSFKESRTQPVNYNTTGEGFVTKFNNNGNLIWSTYYGICEIRSVDTDSNSNIFISGDTQTNPHIATSGTHQPTFSYSPSGVSEYDSFIGKFNSNGQRIWGTYYGGYKAEFNFSLKVDSEDNIYISGHTKSGEFISTTNAHQLNRLGISDAYLAKFNQNGILIWGTYYGGTDSENSERYSIDINVNDEIFLFGSTWSSNNISTLNTYSETLNGSEDCFIVKFNKYGSRIWGTYFGGSITEYGKVIKVDNSGGIYIMGYSYSSNGITTPGSHQTTIANIPGHFIVKFYDCQSAIIASSNSPLCTGNNLQLSASGGTNYSWTGPNGFTSTQQNPIINNANATHSGQYTCTISGTGGCDGSTSINVVVGDTIAPIPNTASLPTINGDCNTIITTIPTATDNCAGNITATTTSPLNYSVPGSYTITWNYNDGNGNTTTQNQTVVISATALPVAGSPQQFCIQDNATLNNITITGQNIKWYDAPTAGNLLTNTTLLQNGTTYYASQTINSCESTRVPVTVTIQNTPAPTGSTAQSFCSSQNATLNDITISGTNIIWYSSLTGNTVLPATTLVANNTTYYATQTVNNCESPTRFSITTTLINTLNANNHSETICDDLNNGSETVNLSNYNTDLIAPTSGAVFSYYHSQNGAENQIGSDQITNYSNFNLSVGNHLIFVRIDSANGCHQIVELNLTLASKPSIPITDIMPICEGSDITVSAGTGFDSYLWSTAETSSSITITAPGNYSVTVTENHGSISCSSVKNFTVVNSNAATISNIVTTDWTSNQNTISVLLTSNSTGNYLYSIDGVHYQTSNTFTNLPHGEYTVFVKDDNGCGIRTEDVYLLMYPNFFTPNGDGFNDYWKIEFSEYEPNLNVQIFDRYGKLLKELGANSQGWNGTYLGNPVPSSDYWFVVKRQNGKEYRGHFSLKR